MQLSLLRLALFASLFAALGGSTPAARAYALEGKSWADGSHIILQMELGTPSQPLLDGSKSWNAAAAPAPDDWNAVMRQVQFSKVMNSTAPISSGDGINTIAFSNTIFGDSFGSGVLAVTTYRTQGNTMVEADVLFNKAQQFDSYRGDLHFASDGTCIADIQRVLLHELGHALGLDHPDQHGQHVDAIMNSVVSNTYQLTADDIAGIQSLYGAPETSATPTPTPKPTASPTPNTPSRLVNLSTRMRVGTGDNVLIGGFIIQGNAKKKVLLRAIGPSLGASGVVGALQDPQMTLLDASGKIIDSNDNWQDSPEMQDIIDSGIPPTDPRESAIVQQLEPGSYTVVVSGVNNTTGIALVENYTLDTYLGSRAANISTRGRVGVEDDALIGGFIVRGTTTKTVLLRALGPSLAGSTNSPVLQNPFLQLRDGDGNVIAQNDDWQVGAQAAAISDTGIPPTDARESALIITLNAGNYTAIVTGVNQGQGLGLVEIYDLNQ